MGRRPLTPPYARIRPPKKNPWRRPGPRRLPDGQEFSPEPSSPEQIEKDKPPSDALLARADEPEGHWHRSRKRRLHHEGRLWGAWNGRRWAWYERRGGRWWVWASPEAPALLRHEGRWWWKDRGVWFLLHNGQPWGWRYLPRWRQEGLVHASGTELVYSRSGDRLAVSVPGAGAVVYDARSGAELARLSSSQVDRPARAPSLPLLPE